MVVNYKKLNPNGFWLLRCLQDEALRYVVLYGGSSSGKSFSVAQVVLIMTLWDGENSLVMRKVGAAISKTIYEDFRVAAQTLGVSDMFKFVQNCCRCVVNGAKIDFSGLDDPEKVKGISNYKRVLLEELSEFELQDWKQIRKRLRGKKGQQIVATFNPINEQHWIKKDFIDMDKWHDVPMQVMIGGENVPEHLCRVKSVRMNEPKMVMNARTGELEQKPSNTVLIQSTYLNNFWVVGSPNGKYGYYDEQCVADFEYDRLHDPDYYNVYALGEWGVIRTGSEFFGSFNIGKHVKPVEYDSDFPIHLSVDNNVLPYISCSMWQVDTSSGKRVVEIGEVCAENPNNTVKKAAVMVGAVLNGMGYDGKVYVHGDASTRAANTFDDEKRSWMDLYIETLKGCGLDVVDCVGDKNPSVAMSGEFINQILDGEVEGVELVIGDSCKNSIIDYQSVQKDVNGAMLKTKVKNKTTGQSYEEHGHLSDTLRYMVVDACRDEFTAFSMRRKRNLYAKDGAVKFYNADGEFEYGQKVLYVMPNVNGMFVMCQADALGDFWHIVSVAYRETISTEEMASLIIKSGSDVCVIECAEAYFPFVRDLRTRTTMPVKVMKEFADVDGRIAATSDYVSERMRFASVQDDEYGRFVDSLYDYNKDGEDKCASAVLSGLAQYVAKKS